METIKKARRLFHLQKENENLQKKIKDDEVNINDLKLQLEVEHAKYMQLVSAKYQSQKNQIVLDMPTLFNDIEEEALKIEAKQTEEVITVSEYTKKKHVPKEKHIDYSSLERKINTLDVKEEDRECDVCGSKMIIDHYEEKEEIYKRRQKEVKPLFDEFLVWLKTLRERNAGRYSMNKAIEYTLNNEKERKRQIK